jgi:hypothetical protein
MRKMRPVPALALITFLSLGVGLYSLRFTAVPFGLSPGIDPAIQTVILNVPVAALAHMILGPIALLTGPWQFFTAGSVRFMRCRAFSPASRRLSPLPTPRGAVSPPWDSDYSRSCGS